MRDREIREEELLAHLGWVQGLALRLVRDATGAEDVAQEAFVHALAHPPRTRTGPALGAFRAGRSGRHERLRLLVHRVIDQLALERDRRPARRLRRSRRRLSAC
ncbi:MAG: hypothetical protein IH804_01825 [Planctomycetes bacterium]|nr:hypothetical protein [Planctomycetota bacterium]